MLNNLKNLLRISENKTIFSVRFNHIKRKHTSSVISKRKLLMSNRTRKNPSITVVQKTVFAHKNTETEQSFLAQVHAKM